MKSIFILACFLVCVFAIRGPQPPLWPQTFSQDFVIVDKKVKLYETGKIWVDYKVPKQRIDLSGSNYHYLCKFLDTDQNTRCSLLALKGALYINLPEKSKCCSCCLTEDQCFLTLRDWLEDYTYAGEAILSGQTFYKWTYDSDSYFATEDPERIPRRIETSDIVQDFIMNTYSIDPISDSVFQVPSNCNQLCPQGSGCRTSTQKPDSTSLKKILFKKF